MKGGVYRMLTIHRAYLAQTAHQTGGAGKCGRQGDVSQELTRLSICTRMCVRKKGGVPTVPVSPSLLRAAVVPG